jgi:prepilin-type N-terminal cleavage/methylation domain-containing protein
MAQMPNKPSAFQTARRAGFTIIELLIAMTIVAVIGIIVYSTFFTVLTSSEVATDASEKLYTQTFLARHLNENLTQAFPGWQAGAVFRPYSTPQEPISQVMPESLYTFVGENNGTEGLFTFSTSTPLAGASGLPGYFKQVTYEIVDASEVETAVQGRGADSMSGSVLQITEVPLMSYDDALGGDVMSNYSDKLKQNAEELEIAIPTWTFPIDGMEMLFFDGEEWVDEWDHLAEERLPWAIDLIFYWQPWGQKIAQEDQETFRMVVSIPGGAGIRNATPAYGRPERIQ